MAVLQVGRVGVDADIDHVSGFRESSETEGRELEINGYIKSSSLANTQAIRTELLATIRSGVIPVTWSEDPTINGYYLLTSVNIDAAANTRSLTGAGFLGFQVTLQRVGTDAVIGFQSRFTGTYLENDLSLTASDDVPWFGLPVGATGLQFKSGSPTEYQRTGADGVVSTYINVDPADAPTWRVDAANYYLGAAYIKVGGYVRAGLDCPNNFNDFELGNSFTRVSLAANNLMNLDQDVHDGSGWDDLQGDWRVRKSDTTNLVPTAITILNNRPEMCAVRLVGHTNGATDQYWTLDLQVRRGSRTITGVLSNNVANNGLVDLNAAGSATSPALGILSNTTSNGHRACIFTANHTRDTSNTRVTGTSGILTFATGAQLNYGATPTNDTANQLGVQYLGWISEQVTPILT